MLIIFNCIIMAPLSYWEIVLLITQSLCSTSITSLTRFPLNLLSKPPGVHCRVETMCTWIPIPTDIVNKYKSSEIAQNTWTGIYGRCDDDWLHTALKLRLDVCLGSAMVVMK